MYFISKKVDHYQEYNIFLPPVKSAHVCKHEYRLKILFTEYVQRKNFEELKKYVL